MSVKQNLIVCRTPLQSLIISKIINFYPNEDFHLIYLTIDGKELVFTRRLKGVNEDFYYSKLKAGEWDLARPLEGDINTPMSEAAQNISSDGQ